MAFDLETIISELGDALDAITGVKVHRFPTELVNPPSIIISLPETVEYDGSYQNSDDTYLLNIVLLVDMAYDRLIVEKLSRYIASEGDSSVKQAVESHTYSTVGSVRVMNATIEPYQYNNTPLMAVVFETQIIE